jgi:hypothetical protein
VVPPREGERRWMDVRPCARHEPAAAGRWPGPVVRRAAAAAAAAVRAAVRAAREGQLSGVIHRLLLLRRCAACGCHHHHHHRAISHYFIPFHPSSVVGGSTLASSPPHTNTPPPPPLSLHHSCGPSAQRPRNPRIFLASDAPDRVPPSPPLPTRHGAPFTASLPVPRVRALLVSSRRARLPLPPTICSLQRATCNHRCARRPPTTPSRHARWASPRPRILERAPSTMPEATRHEAEDRVSPALSVLLPLSPPPRDVRT